MKKEKKIVDTGFVPGIYNYCDRWCERCPLQFRCMSFMMGKKLKERTKVNLGEEMPEEDAVRAYLQGPEEATTLSAEQQIVAIDKLLECAEVNLRTLCDLIRYQQLKDAGVVNSVEEFLSMVRPDDFRDMKREEDVD